jgi:hypothetical protein
MPYAFTLTTTVPASAQDIYEAWLDSLAHTEMTGSEAVMSDEVGAEVAAWDGYISGRNLELVPSSASCSRGARPRSTRSTRIPSLR